MKRAYRTGIAAILFAVLAVSVVDVIGRYFFNAPLLGADDLIRFGMAMLVFGGLPAVCRAGEHITVDLVAGRLPPLARESIARIWNALAALALAYFAWRLFALGERAVNYGDRSPLLLLPYPPLIFFMAGCAALSSAIEFWRMIQPGRKAGSADGPQS